MYALPKNFHNKMNTIKFRIWNPEEKKMIESGATPMMLNGFFGYTARLNTQYGIPYQQFTGLLDRNGKEIYEGDIMKMLEGNIIIGDMEFDNGWEGVYGWLIGYEDSNDREVIGNIYGNKNLCKRLTSQNTRLKKLKVR